MQTVRSHVRRAALAAVLLLGAAGAAAEPHVYVANLGADDVAVLDAATATLVARLPVGDDPNGAAASADGGRIYVTNFLSDSLTVIDAAANVVLAAVPVCAGPVGVALGPDGSRAYVACRGADAVAIVDTAAAAMVGTIAVGRGPNAIAVSPDGRRAWVTNSFTRDPGEVSVLDLSAAAVRATVAVQHVPNRVAVTPDGGTVYVTNFRSWNVAVIDAVTDQVTTTVRVGYKPTGIAVNPNGAYAYVTAQVPHARVFGPHGWTPVGSVDIIDVASRRVRESLQIGAAPSAVAILRNGGTAYVTDFAGGALTVVDLGDELPTAEVAVGDRPFAVAVSCAGAGCSETPYTPKPTKTVTDTPTVTPTPTATRTPSRTATQTATATLRPGLEHVQIDLVPYLDGVQPILDVTLRTGGQTVTAFSHEIAFAPGVRVAEAQPGVPDCQIFESPPLQTADFAFVPAGCRSACDGLRAALHAATPFLDLDLPAVPYFCRLEIADAIPPGTYRLRNRDVAARGVAGEILAARGRDGIVTIQPPSSPSPAISPRPTRTPLPSPTGTATPFPEVFLRIGSARGPAGAAVTVAVHLDARGRQVAGTQNDLLFPAAARVPALANGRPDCTANPAIDKGATAFSFIPSGCADDACVAVRALVLAIDNTDPIPDGALLYSCRFAIRPGAAPGPYALGSRELGASTPDGGAIPTGAVDGTLTVSAAAALERAAGETGARVCAAGSRDGRPCAADADCAGGACVRPQGICAGGPDAGLLCDCPGGRCEADSLCLGGVDDGVPCDPTFNCRDGATCVETHRLCAAGASKGMPCLDHPHCIAAACVASARRCAGGDFDRVACIDAGDCPRGACIDPHAPPPGATATPTPAPQPDGEDDGCALSGDAHRGAAHLLAPLVALLLAGKRSRVRG